MVVIVCFLSGCVQTTALQMSKPFTEPSFGMSKDELLALLGKPQELHIYKKKDESLVEFDTYLWQNGDVKESVPICIINKKVVGWGKSYYEDHFDSDDIKIK